MDPLLKYDGSETKMIVVMISTDLFMSEELGMIKIINVKCTCLFQNSKC